MKLTLLKNVDYDIWSYDCLPHELEAALNFFAVMGVENPGIIHRSGVFTDAYPQFTADVAAALLAYVHERAEAVQ